MPESAATKRMLADALKQLINEHPLEKVTVVDICQRCGMSRKGFYYHFKDKYDLLNWIFYTEFFESALPTEPSEETLWDFFNKICAYLYENRRFYVAAFAVKGQNSFSEYFSELIEPLTESYLDRVFESSAYHAFYAGFFTDAFRLAIVRWLRGQTQILPGEFVDLLKNAVASLAQRALSDPSFGNLYVRAQAPCDPPDAPSSDRSTRPPD